MGLICIFANTSILSAHTLKENGEKDDGVASKTVCLCACQCSCVCVLVLLWCHGAVAALLSGPELCEAASPSPSLSGPALRALPRTGAPRTICRVLLIVVHNALTP